MMLENDKNNLVIHYIKCYDFADNFFHEGNILQYHSKGQKTWEKLIKVAIYHQHTDTWFLKNIKENAHRKNVKYDA